MARKKKDPVIAGIDVSRDELVVALSGVDGTASFPNSDEGHRTLLRYFHKRRVERAA